MYIAVVLFFNHTHVPIKRYFTSKEFKHCSVFFDDGKHKWYCDINECGLSVRILDDTNTTKFVNRLKLKPSVSALIALTIKNNTQFGYSPFIMKSCNEMVRYYSSLDIGITFTPKHLYNKLLWYNNERNYSILHHWRRAHGEE